MLPLARQILLTITVSCLAAVACGWGAEGHRIIGIIAANHLSPPAQAGIRDLLGTQTLADASQWADQIRRTRRETRQWHYVDFDITTGKLLGDYATAPNVLDAISSQSQVLACSGDKTLREEALKYVVHFVGDLHQPLHCSNNNDRGGNETMVNFFGRTTKLHALWDTHLPEKYLCDQGLTAETAAARLEDRFSTAAAQLATGTTTDWAAESLYHARTTVYSFLSSGRTSGTIELDPEYYDAAVPVLERQLACAGFRLAALLNKLFASRPYTAPMPEIIPALPLMETIPAPR
jgi:hypothetical protein